MSQYLRPTSLDEALKLRREHPHLAILAGGTDLMVGALERQAPAGFIDVFGLQGLTTVTKTDAQIRIGAAVPYAQLLENEDIKTRLPNLWTAIRQIGAAQIQSRGTMGGNLMTSSPVGDTLPCLLALDAEIELAATSRTRKIPYAKFCTGYRQTQARPDELVVAINIPWPASSARLFWRKVGTRQAQAISKVMIAGHAELGETLSAVRIAAGAVADRPVRLSSVEALLEGKKATEALAQAAHQEALKAISPIDDVRSSADYRLATAANLVRRFVSELAVK